MYQTDPAARHDGWDYEIEKEENDMENIVK